MKYVIFGFVGAAVMALCVAGLVTINGKAARENELNNAVLVSCKEALNLCRTDEGDGDKAADDELLKKHFSDNLLSQIQAGDDAGDDNLALNIDYLGADYEKGLISVCVKEKYTGAFGRVCEISSKATAVVDRREQSGI